MEAFLLKLKELSSAEDFLQYFNVPFDPHVVNVSRLHILKRFFQYIRQQNLLSTHTELDLYTSYRDQLLKAYGDFVTSTPAQEKVFKVFQDSIGVQHVPLERLRASLSTHVSA